MIEAVRQSGGINAAANAGRVNKSKAVDFSEVLEETQGGSSDKKQTASLDDIFERASRQYGVPAELLKAVAKQESNFKADAVSRSGAMGIMQLMPATARGLGVEDAYDPEENIMGGAKFLSQMLDKYDGNVKLALAAYNAGPGNVAKYGGVPPFKETQNYVVKVMGYYDGGVSVPAAENARTEKPVTPAAPAGAPENNRTEPSMVNNGEEEEPVFTLEDYEEFLSLWKQQRQTCKLELNLYGRNRIFEKDEEDQRGTIFG